jgi:phosphoglycolate phosphatase
VTGVGEDFMPRLIVFDWDGTLADSVNKIIDCKHFLARKYDLPPPAPSVIRGVLGTRFRDAMKNCFPSASESLLETLCAEFHPIMQQPEYQADLFPGAAALLDLLKAQGLKLAVATSKNRHELNSALVHTGLTDALDITCCGAEHKEKPDPAMLHHIMRTFQVPPDDCVMVGDTVADVAFADNAGVRTVCVTFGAQPAEKLRSLNPIALIDSLSELPKVIDALPRNVQSFAAHLA